MEQLLVGEGIRPHFGLCKNFLKAVSLQTDRIACCCFRVMEQRCKAGWALIWRACLHRMMEVVTCWKRFSQRISWSHSNCDSLECRVGRLEQRVSYRPQFHRSLVKMSIGRILPENTFRNSQKLVESGMELFRYFHFLQITPELNRPILSLFSTT